MSDTNKVKVVAVYMGWKYSNTTKDGRDLYERGDKIQWIDTHIPYNTSIEWLYPVAGRVVAELAELHNETTRSEVHSAWGAILDANNTFDIAQLFEATVAGIEIINRFKNENDGK